MARHGNRVALAALAVLTMGATAPTPVRIEPVSTGARPQGPSVPLHIGGRGMVEGDALRRQWPGSYVEASFADDSADLRIGPGDVRLHILVDGRPAATLVKPKPGLYRLTGLGKGPHRLRVEVASESQAGPTMLGGVYARHPLPVRPRARRVEFIGDSHTVGYGNTADGQTCTPDQVWDTTDTSQGIAGQLGRRYDADYRVNAISGRGVVRNYNGFAADPLPVAYRYTLFDHDHVADDRGWQPQLYVVALGTNDFSTLLHQGEVWADRAALHRDYETRYAAFLRDLHAANPRAHIFVWATDKADGEIAAEAGKVVEQLRAQGIADIGFATLKGLSFGGCNSHPTVADDRRIADAVAGYVDAHPTLWNR